MAVSHPRQARWRRDGPPTQGIVVASGLLHHGHREIGIAQVHSANAKQIVLNITKDAYEAMAE